jgi:DNA-binding MarR family transcriptional regulator
VQFVAGERAAHRHPRQAGDLAQPPARAELKLGPSDSQFMTLLDVHGPLTPGRLAELTGLRTGTVTGVLDRLEKAGFVRRDRDPHDRRKVIVTPVAEAVDERLRPHYAGQADVMGKLLDRYDDTELAAILDFVRGVNGQGSPR